VLGTFAVAPALGLYQHLVKKEKVDPLKIAEGVALTTLGSLGLTCEGLAADSIYASTQLQGCATLQTSQAITIKQTSSISACLHCDLACCSLGSSCSRHRSFLHAVLVGSVKLLQMDREGMEDRVYR
jgi:hypothetical protein